MGAAQTLPLSVVNFGGAPLSISSATSDVAGVTVTGLPATVDIGAEAQLQVHFSALTAGTFTGTLTLTSNADPTVLPLTAMVSSSPLPDAGTDAGLPKLAAFPEAGGGGAAAVGGRGGQVIEVTNLNDSGAGSLRDCISASMPRTCVFTIGGVINLARVNVTNPYLTIAGQTAPGGGITLRSVSPDYMLFISTHDVVIRYVAIRGPNYPLMVANADEGHDIIFDHLSISWAKQLLDVLSNTGNALHSITMQGCIASEPAASHPIAIANFTDIDGGPSETDIDFHHNLISTFAKGAPVLTNRSTRVVNNLIYNWGAEASAFYGGITADVVGNVYKAGPLDMGAHEVQVSTSGSDLNPGTPSLYLAENLGPHLQSAQSDLAAEDTGDGTNETGAAPSAWLRTSPMPATYFNGSGGYVAITIDPAANLEALLLPIVGNSRGLDCTGAWVARRDSVDARIINEYLDGGVGALFDPLPDGGYPVPNIANGTPCVSTSHDGIPDVWAGQHGLDAGDPDKGTRDAGNGWTWLDRYLDGF